MLQFETSQMSWEQDLEMTEEAWKQSGKELGKRTANQAPGYETTYYSHN